LVVEMVFSWILIFKLLTYQNLSRLVQMFGLCGLVVFLFGLWFR